MFVRNGQKLGSVLVDSTTGTGPEPRKRTTKKAAARKTGAPPPARAEPAGDAEDSGEAKETENGDDAVSA